MYKVCLRSPFIITHNPVLNMSWFLVAQHLYIPISFFLLFFFFCPSMVCGMQACGSCGGQWGAEGSQEGRGAPKPNQNWKSIPNQTKPKLSPIICAWQNQINIEQLNQIKLDNPFQTKPNCFQPNPIKRNLPKQKLSPTICTWQNQIKRNLPKQT